MQKKHAFALQGARDEPLQVADPDSTRPPTREDAETYDIIGAAMRVHSQLGPGFLEAVYQEAMEMELESCGIPFRREVDLVVYYGNRPLRCRYRADFLCHESIVVELKAIRSITAIEEAQVINYLKATRLGRAVLLNFANARLEFHRFVNSKSKGHQHA